MRRRSMRRSRRAHRCFAILVLIGVVFMLGTQGADASIDSLPSLSLSSLSKFAGSLAAGSPQWSKVPQQQSGTAADLGHQVPAAATRANQGVGHAPGSGRGALPAYAPTPGRQSRD